MKTESRWWSSRRGNLNAAFRFPDPRLSLRTRLAVALLLLGWLPLLITLPLQYRLIDRNLGAHAELELVQLSEVQQRRINRELKRNTDELALVASRTQMRISLDAFHQTADLVHQAFVNRILHDAAASIGNLKGIWVYDLEGRLVASAGSAATLPAESVFGQLPEHDGVRFGPYWFAEGCERMIWLGTELDLEGRHIGRLVLALGVGGLIELLDDFPDPSLIGQSYAVLKGPGGARCVLTSSTQGTGAYVRVLPSERELLSFVSQMPAGAVTTKVVDGGASQWMMLPLIYDSGYLVVRSAPGLQADTRNLILAGYGLLVLLVLAMAALFSLWVARRIAAPLYELVDAVVAARRGASAPEPGGEGWPWELRILRDELVRTLKTQRRFVSAMRREVRQRRQAQSQLLDLANTDELTGLANRRYLIHRIDERIRSVPANGALLFMDLDRFKPVNDDHGHHVGDEVLKAVAERLVHALRDQDLPARMGGDEFAVLLIDDEQPIDAKGVADRIEKAISQPITVGKVTVTIGCSIGHVQLNADMSVRETLQRADEAMYRVKASRGRRH